MAEKTKTSNKRFVTFLGKNESLSEMFDSVFR